MGDTSWLGLGSGEGTESVPCRPGSEHPKASDNSRCVQLWLQERAGHMGTMEQAIPVTVGAQSLKQVSIRVGSVRTAQGPHSPGFKSQLCHPLPGGGSGTPV